MVVALQRPSHEDGSLDGFMAARWHCDAAVRCDDLDLVIT